MKIDLIGQGDKIATYAGVNVKKTVMVAMLISGALCGLLDGMKCMVFSTDFWKAFPAATGISQRSSHCLVALNPLGIVIASFFFSALLVGGATMQRMTEVPYSVVDIIQGLVIVFVIARTAIISDCRRNY